MIHISSSATASNGFRKLSNTFMIFTVSVSLHYLPSVASHLYGKTAYISSCYVDVMLQMVNNEMRQAGAINIVTLNHHKLDRVRLPL